MKAKKNTTPESIEIGMEMENETEGKLEVDCTIAYITNQFIVFTITVNNADYTVLAYVKNSKKIELQFLQKNYDDDIVKIALEAAIQIFRQNGMLVNRKYRFWFSLVSVIIGFVTAATAFAGTLPVLSAMIGFVLAMIGLRNAITYHMLKKLNKE